MRIQSNKLIQKHHHPVWLPEQFRQERRTINAPMSSRRKKATYEVHDHVMSLEIHSRKSQSLAISSLGTINSLRFS